MELLKVTLVEGNRTAFIVPSNLKYVMPSKEGDRVLLHFVGDTKPVLVEGPLRSIFTPQDGYFTLEDTPEPGDMIYTEGPNGSEIRAILANAPPETVVPTPILKEEKKGFFSRTKK